LRGFGAQFFFPPFGPKIPGEKIGPFSKPNPTLWGPFPQNPQKITPRKGAQNLNSPDPPSTKPPVPIWPGYNNSFPPNFSLGIPPKVFLVSFLLPRFLIRVGSFLSFPFLPGLSLSWAFPFPFLGIGGFFLKAFTLSRPLSRFPPSHLIPSPYLLVRNFFPGDFLP